MYKHENQVISVASFQDLVSTTFYGEKNAICWHRELHGDFAEIVSKVDFEGNMIELSVDMLQALSLSVEGELVRETLLTDMEYLRAHGALPMLNLIRCYERDDMHASIPTDVYSYHVDRSPIPSDTFLCTYYGESSDILPNSQAIQKILVPEIRQELQDTYAVDDRDFDAFAKEYFFDLHYLALPAAKPINLGLWHMWKLAVDHPQSRVLPCVHRAPKEFSGKTRLLMIC